MRISLLAGAGACLLAVAVAGPAETEVPFAFTPNRSPRSIVVHEAESTATDAGHAGTAGGRAACLTLPPS